MKLAVKVHQYWEDLRNLSMPDKNIFQLEIKSIKKLLGPGLLLDVGCGDGEATKEYARVKNLRAAGIDYSASRLKLARKNYPGIKFITADLTKKLPPAKYDYIVSQRFLINLESWAQQKQIIVKLKSCLKPRGKLILCEGSQQGTKALDEFRAKFKLAPISVRWHNVFLDDQKLIKLGFKLAGGFGGYFLLTRGIRPYFDQGLNWNCQFNRWAAKINLPNNFSRLKIWQYEAKN